MPIHPLPDDVSNFTSLATYANTVTDNSFWNIMLLSIMLVGLAIMLSRGVPKEESFLVVSSLGLILSGLLASMALVNYSLLFLFSILFALSIVLLWFRSEKSLI